ncbi:MAG: SUMF1/EgtB/PvdO family nonheme iron enzyme, partial [Chloroflexales bacterium]
RQQRDSTPDPALRAALDAAITALEAAQQAQVSLSSAQTGDVSVGDVAGRDQIGQQTNQQIGGEANVGAAVAGDVGRDLTLFTGEASGNYIADVIHLYQQAPAAPQADYGAALRRYLKHLYVTHGTLDLRGIDQRQMDMPLSEVYVSLTVREVAPSEGVLRGGVRAFIEKVRQVVGKEAQEPPGREQAVEWTTILRQQKLAVIGLPGSGKTTLLQYTAVRLCEVLARDDSAHLTDLGLGDDAGQHPPVPLLLPLRELGAFLGESRIRELAGANSKLLLDCLANYYQGFDLDLPEDFFRRLGETGRAIFLLDGLDEVPQTDDRVLVSAIVRSLVNRYPACRYVLTSRPKAYEGDARLGQGFRECTVDDLSAEKQQRFIGNWSRSLHRLLGHQGDDAERPAARFSSELWGALETNDRVRDLATNPLLLTIIAIIYYDSRSLPENRAELYEACVTVLLKGGRGKVDKAAKQRENYSGRPSLSMSLRQKRELLAFVAYRMHQRGADTRESTGREIGRDDLVVIVADSPALPAGCPPLEAAEAFVDELPVHVGLLDEIRPRVFRFSHLSFQEFLAARYVAEGERWAELLDHAQEPWWREVILLCAGHLSQERCWRFLAQLITRGTTPLERAANLALAADAILELEKFKGQGPLNAQISAEARRILEVPLADAPAAARVAAGNALAVVGDPRPGVCTLPPPMVQIAGGSVMIGSSKAEADAAGRAYEAYYLKRGEKERAKSARDWPKDEVNDRAVDVAAFAVARYPVTNAQFKLFMDGGGYNPDAAWWSDAARVWLARDDATTKGLDDWQRRTFKDKPKFWADPRFGIARPNHPVVGVNWYEATAFCRWLTQYLNDRYVYRLPGEAEWEYAARGSERRIYPWGNPEPDDERANFNQQYQRTTAVGCFPAGATPGTGLLDMAGNVWEWTRSEYRPYPYDPTDGREDGAEPAKKRFTLRGGSWADGSIDLRAAARDGSTPDYHDRDVGFRLARHRA